MLLLFLTFVTAVPSPYEPSSPARAGWASAQGDRAVSLSGCFDGTSASQNIHTLFVFDNDRMTVTFQMDSDMLGFNVTCVDAKYRVKGDSISIVRGEGECMSGGGNLKIKDVSYSDRGDLVVVEATLNGKQVLGFAFGPHDPQKVRNPEGCAIRTGGNLNELAAPDRVPTIDLGGFYPSQGQPSGGSPSQGQPSGSSPSQGQHSGSKRKTTSPPTEDDKKKAKQMKASENLPAIITGAGKAEEQQMCTFCSNRCEKSHVQSPENCYNMFCKTACDMAAQSPHNRLGAKLMQE